MTGSKDRTAGRSAACSVCQKTFARNDTLLRHQKSHHATDDRGPLHRVTDGTFRACLGCAAARSRCSGGFPCARCGIRNIECAYPKKRRKNAGDVDEVRLGSASLQNRFHVNSPSPPNQSNYDSTSHSQPTQKPPANYGQQNHEPLRFVDASGYAIPDRGTEQQHLSSTMHSNQSEQTVRPNGVQTQQQFTNSPAIEPAFQVQSQHEALPIGSNNFAPLPSHDRMSQAYYDTSHANFEYPAAWDDSLNWIPISVYPSPYDGELEHDFSFLLPPLSESSNVGFDYGQPLPDSNTQLYQVSSTNSAHPESLSGGRKLSVAFTGLAQSPTSSASNDLSGGRPAGESTTFAHEKKKRRKSSTTATDTFLQPRNRQHRPSFPAHILSSSEDPDFHPRDYCSIATFEILVSAFRRLCHESVQHQPFETNSFPDASSFNRYIDLYFEHFHPNFPLIHRPSLGPTSHWMLILAAATIGSNFVQATYAFELRNAFQDFLRRAITECSGLSADDSFDATIGQVRILNLISLSQAEDDVLRGLTSRYHAELSHWCLESGALQLSAIPVSLPDATNATQTWQQWQNWINSESLHRIGNFTWLLDTSLAYTANIRPMCNMDDARTPLPCADDLWNIDNAEEWASKIPNISASPSLCVALEHLYNKKAVYPGLSNVSQALLINALFQRTWEVGTHIKQPLSEWVPTGKARGFLNTPSKDDFWLPLYPLYANWRNSACDCLDVINWQAASIVAKASGKEHNLMLHLHLARIILLTPFQEIQDLLFSLIGRVGDSSKASFYVHDGSYQPRNKAKLPQIRKITWRWLREDQHKARLAMVHAGSVFWHVRRYSSNSFYEPIAVYLASLVLWTYGSYKSAALERNAANANSKPVGGPSGPDADLTAVQPSRVERKIRVQDVLQNDDPPEAEVRGPHGSGQASSSSSESESDSAQIDLIYLDRPCDDEMIQHFVRNGHNMTAHVSNIGDICKTPRKVLLEGAKLLRTRLGCWGVSREYFDILTRLAEMRKG